MDNIPAYIQRVKHGEFRLFGFGHRVYKNYDPRAKIIKRVAEEVFDVTGRNPLIDIAVELERIALQDERSEEHTSELQSLAYLVCRLLLEKKKKKINNKE